MASARQLEFGAILSEATWGTRASGTYLAIPWDSYEVHQTNELQVRNKYTGAVDTINVDQGGQILRGSAQCEVHPDTATLLLKTIPGLARSTVEGKPNWIPSFTYRFFDAAFNKYYEHLGLMADSMRISCGPGLGAELMVSYDFVGKYEGEISSFSAPSMPDQASFQWKHAAGGVTIGGVVEPNIESWEITIANNLRPAERPDANGRIAWLDAGVRDCSFRGTLRTHTDFAQDYHGIVRGQNTGMPVVIVFNYPGTGSPADQITITIPLLVIAEPVRGSGVRDMQSLAISGTAKKSAGSDVLTISVS